MLGILADSNISDNIFNYLNIFGIINLGSSNKVVHNIVQQSDIWHQKLYLISRVQRKNDNILKVLISNSLYKTYVDLYSANSGFKNMNFYLKIDNFLCTSNMPLIIFRTGDTYTLQSIRDANWECIFDSNQLNMQPEIYHKEITLSLYLNSDLLMTFKHRLILPIFTSPYRYSGTFNGINFNFLIIRKSTKYFKKEYDYKIQFPYLTLSCEDLRDLVFGMNMNNKFLQIKYCI